MHWDLTRLARSFYLLSFGLITIVPLLDISRILFDLLFPFRSLHFYSCISWSRDYSNAKYGLIPSFLYPATINYWTIRTQRWCRSRLRASFSSFWQHCRLQGQTRLEMVLLRGFQRLTLPPQFGFQTQPSWSHLIDWFTAEIKMSEERLTPCVLCTIKFNFLVCLALWEGNRRLVGQIRKGSNLEIPS